MISPYQLSDDALAILRLFVQAGTRDAGATLDRAAIDASGKLAADAIGPGVIDLVDAGLATPESVDGGVVLSEDGAAFFRRYYRSCH